MRHALRLLVRTPGASALVLTILALAVAANVTLFSVLDAALFRGVPLPDADRLVNLYTIGARGSGYGGLSLPDFQDVRAALTAPAAGSATDVFGYGGLMAAAAVDGGSPEVVFGEIVTANYFSVSGAPLALGRGFGPADDDPGEPARVVLGHRFWQRRFAGDPSVVGRTVRLNGLPFTVVGVAAEGFPGLLFSGLAADLWAPLSWLTRFRGDVREDRAERWLFVKARLADGADVAQAAATLDVVGGRLRAAYPNTNRERTFRAIRSSDVMINPEADPALRPLAIAVVALGLLVLVIASANVASVLAARVAGRSRELAVRVSIGATRGQLVALLSAEALVLGAGALILGLGLSSAALATLQAWRPSLPVPLGWTFAIDGRVLLFAVSATLLTMIAVVVLPAWRASRIDPLAVLRGHDRVSARRLGRERLLIPQIALSLVLLVVAGLFVRSLQSAARLDPGFTPENAAVMAIKPELSGYDRERAMEFWWALAARIESRPGIRAAALTDRIPLDLYGNQSATVKSDRIEQAESMQSAHVGAKFFDVLRIPILAGRAFTVLDGTTDRRVAIVSQSAAARLWPGQDAVGERVQIGGAKGEWHSVVGVAGDVQLIETLGEADSPLIYLPMTSSVAGLIRVVAASDGRTPLKQELMAAAREIDPDVAVIETTGLDTHLDNLLLPYKAAAFVALGAGLFGLLLTMAGTAASVAHVLAWRTRELGIRMALGASRWALLRAATARAASSMLIGLAAGAIGGLAAAQGLGGYLFGIGPMDPLTLIAVPLLVIAATALAMAPSIRRALKLDAASVLRTDG